VGARLTRALEKDKPVEFEVVVINTGREPARDVSFRFLNSTIEGYDQPTTSFYDIQTPTGSPCEGLRPEKDRVVFPPSIANISAFHRLNSLHGAPGYTIDEKLIDGQRFYVVSGCMVYITFGSAHHSTFCYILETRRSPAEPGPPLESFSSIAQGLPTFVGCPSGFEST
jgi:hypothetical protein